ncbi:MAG: hypothetical protein M5U14_11015 [Acidimicrobiia bacterium]|nr:hypothetical protein [Acidimicrobiia bacterium]
MVLRISVAGALLLLAVAVAWLVERRRRPQAPARDAYPVPRQLDRQDFPRPDAPWLVALFSSATCASCEVMAAKVAALESPEVASCDIEWSDRRDLHERYAVPAVPLVVVADCEGVVRAAFVGAASATDLWAAVAELRRPGSTPEPELGRLDG